ncbi:hypothetical protein BD0109_10400 [Helicobacter pylori]
MDLIQKGFDDFSDNAFNQIESLKKEFSEKEESKRENLEKLNQVINSFKESIDKVFDRASAFTFEKYKEENDDEEGDGENYREFEEIKEMALFFRDLEMYRIDCYDYSQEEIEEERENIDEDNEILQLDYSLANLSRLREYKETNEEFYQECLNDSDLQNNLREWRRQKKDYNSSVLSSALFEQVRSIIAEQLNVDAAQVTPEAKFVKDLGVDSLDVVELIMALEEKFGIEIPDEQAEKIVNVGDVMRYIEKQLI